MGLKICAGIPLADWTLDHDVDGDGLSDGWASGVGLSYSVQGGMYGGTHAYPFGSGVTQRLVLAGGAVDTNPARVIAATSPSGYLNAGMNGSTFMFHLFVTYSWEPGAGGLAWSVLAEIRNASGGNVDWIGGGVITPTAGAYITTVVSSNITIGSSENPDHVRITLGMPDRVAGASVLKIAAVGFGFTLSPSVGALPELSTIHNHPVEHYQRDFTSFDDVAHTGATRVTDPTGGRKKWYLKMPYRGMPVADYTTVQQYYQANRARPPIATAAAAPVTYLRGVAYPLIIQPGLNECPGFMYANFTGKGFPLRQDHTWDARLYRGDLEFEEV